jgi:hypothetical protein
MTAGEARPGLLEALDAVGRLTARQAAALLAVSPAQAGRFLVGLCREGLAVGSLGAYWSPRVPRTLAAHRELVADVFITVRRDPRLVAWEGDAPGAHPGSPVRPDALIRWRAAADDPPRPVAVEADTGSETRRQWDEKLRRYDTSDATWRLLVIARSPKRRRHLAEWLTASPRPCRVSDPDGAPEALTALAAETPAPRPVPGPAPAAAPRPLVYRRDDATLSDAAAQVGLATGTLRPGAREREAGRDVLHLNPARGPHRRPPPR